jgi:hypothetical protein
LELRTKVKIDNSKHKIGYTDSVMFIGSCFASSIGTMMKKGRMPVMINPSGSVYNPVSVCNTIETLVSNKVFEKKDLYQYDGSWLSFFHYTDFEDEDPEKLLNKINTNTKEAHEVLGKASFLFLTLGTARVYRIKETGQIVSNCHKVPSTYFENELLSVDEVTEYLDSALTLLHSQYPGLKVVFTVSPIRHWKDGAHDNNVSKSVLFLAIEKMMGHPSSPQYFPAYELLMDDLRDYRFYEDDMLHPSAAAINYIWEAFTECYLEKETQSAWNDVSKIVRATEHRINSGSEKKVKIFAEQMLKKISDIQHKYPYINLSAEKNYFSNL